jgi:hypothetical protein
MQKNIKSQKASENEICECFLLKAEKVFYF